MTESADTSDAVPDDVSMSSPREFRQPEWYGALFSGGLLFFVGMAASSVWAAATNADGSFPQAISRGPIRDRRPKPRSVGNNHRFADDR